MRFLVYGVGAVGGVIAARLAQAGHDVVGVARGAHLAAIRDHGLVLESADGRRAVDLGVVPTATDHAWRGDEIVLLAVKGHQTAAALADLAEATEADRDGVEIVCAQNGVGNEALVAERFRRVLGMCVMMPATHLEPGVVVQQCHPVPGILDVGRFPDGVDETTRRVTAALVSAGFVSEPRADIMAWKHRKLILNLGNAVQACFTPGPDADRLQEAARAEGEAVLAAAGITVVGEREDAERRGDLLRGRQRRDALGSSWQSLTRGTGEVEADHLNGEISRLGRSHGVATPVNDALVAAALDLAARRGTPRSLDPASVLHSR